MLKFVESTFNHDLPIEDYRTIFEMVSINQSVSLPNRNDVAAVIRQIATNIKSGDEKKMNIGLSWLHEVIAMSSCEILNQYCQMWMKILLDILTNSSTTHKDEIFKICKMLLNRLSPTQVDVFSDDISSLVQHILLTNPSEKHTSSLECLEVILKISPDVCRRHMNSIEYFLVSYFASFNGKGVEVIATCLSHMPSLYGEQCGTAWSRQFSKIINTLLKVMDTFFRIISLEMGVEVQDFYNLPDVRGHPYPFVLYLRYFNTLCVCAVKMLCGKPIYTAIPARKAMKFIDIVFSYPEKANNMNHLSPHKIPWLTILPNMVKSTSELLESLILNCWEALHGYASSLLTLIITKLNTFVFPDSNLRILRCYVYRIIGALTTKLKDTSLENHYPMMINLLFEDIQVMPLENKTAFDDRFDMVTPSSSRTSAPESLSVEVKRKCCHEALRVLSTFITTGKISNIEDIIEEVLKVFKILSVAPSFLIPYDDDSTRLQLYNILLSGITKLPPSRSNSFSLCLRYFQRGVNDIDTQVANFCRMAVHLSSSLPSLKQTTSKGAQSFESETSTEETLPKHSVKDYFGDGDIELILKETFEVLTSESDDAVTNHITAVSANQEDDEGQLNNHNDEEDMDEEILENDESFEDEQMNESEEEGEIDDDEEEEEEEEEEEIEEEEEFEEDSKAFEVEVPEKDSESQTKEKPQMDNGYFTMQNGTVSSDEGTPTTNDKKEESIVNNKAKHTERSKEIEDSPPPKKLKHLDERSQDGSISDSDSVNVNAMIADFVDKPPEDKS